MNKRKLTRESLTELAMRMPVLSEEVQSFYVGGGTVKISVNRTGYGSDTTMSSFLATAYDDSGTIIDSLEGFFLEPAVDYGSCTPSGFISGLYNVADSDTAIAPGTYNVVPGYYHQQSGYYEVSDVEGRSYIMIHAGNNGSDTLGCLMPGVTGSYHSGIDDYTVSQSKVKLQELTEFLDKYGDDGITIDISY